MKGAENGYQRLEGKRGADSTICRQESPRLVSGTGKGKASLEGNQVVDGPQTIRWNECQEIRREIRPGHQAVEVSRKASHGAAEPIKFGCFFI